MRVDISTAQAALANRGILAFCHAIYLAFHVTALYFGVAYLLITIPVHLIYTAVALAKQDSLLRVQIRSADVAPQESLPLPSRQSR